MMSFKILYLCKCTTAISGPEAYTQAALIPLQEGRTKKQAKVNAFSFSLFDAK
jgi:hypothetical protein